MSARRFRVMMTADAVGGVWTYAGALSRGLCDLDCEVSLVVIGPRPRPDQKQIIDRRVELIETDLALEWEDPEGRDVARARTSLRNIARHRRPHVVHLNGYREASFGWREPVIVAAHSCVGSWAEACRDTAFIAEPRWRNYSSEVARGLREASAWVAPTASFRDEIITRYGVPGGRVIWNGLTRASAKSAAKEPFILAAGRIWDRAKNLALLSAIGPPSWPLKIAGATDAQPGLFSAGITHLGELSHRELIAVMQRAAVFVSPARYEPFGLAVLEAAAAGCALVLSDIRSFRELWDGAAMFVAAGDDTEQLANGLRAVIEDEQLRLRLQNAARDRSAGYSAVQMAKSYFELYQSMLAGRTTSRERPRVPSLAELSA